MGWNKLPVEIAAIIFLQLEPADLISIMSSCRAILILYQASEAQIKHRIKAQLGDTYLDLVLYESAPICLSMKKGYVTSIAKLFCASASMLTELDSSWSKFKTENGKITYPEWMLRVRQIQPQFISICFNQDLARPLLTLPRYDRPTLGTLHRFLKRMKTLDRHVFYYMNWLRDEIHFVAVRRKNCATTPSAAERVRLRRGFIRYEMMCQLTARSRWNVMLGILDGAEEESASDRERAVRQLSMSESGFLEAVPYVVAAEVTSIACFVFSRHREMLMDFYEELFKLRKAYTPTGEEVDEEMEPDGQPHSNREFTYDEWEKENLLYLSSAVGLGLGYLERVQDLSDMARPSWFRLILGHFQPAEHSHVLRLMKTWDEVVGPVQEQGGTFEAETPVRMPPQPQPGSSVRTSYGASSYPGFHHIFSGQARSSY